MTPLNRSIAGCALYASTDNPAKLAAIKAKLDQALRPRPVQPPSWMRDLFRGLKSGSAK